MNVKLQSSTPEIKLFCVTHVNLLTFLAIDFKQFQLFTKLRKNSEIISPLLKI